MTSQRGGGKVRTPALNDLSDVEAGSPAEGDGVFWDEAAQLWRSAAPSGSSVGFDYVQQADPGAVGAGKLWLKLPPDVNPDTWQASHAYGFYGLVVPTAPNGHYYNPSTSGTSDVAEPAWPTDGGTVTDGTITWEDLGLIGAVPYGSHPAAFRRRDDDGGWDQLAASDTFGNGASSFSHFDPRGQKRTNVNIGNSAVNHGAEDADGHPRASASLQGNGTWRVNVGADLDVATLASLLLDATGLHVVGAITTSGIPTSDPAVAGALWNDAGTLKVSAG